MHRLSRVNRTNISALHDAYASVGEPGAQHASMSSPQLASAAVTVHASLRTSRHKTKRLYFVISYVITLHYI